MRRFFTEPQNISGDTVCIIDDASHITKVLRMSKGDEMLVFDGTGYEYKAKLFEINKNQCIAKILDKKFSASEPNSKVTLFQGIPKSGKMELIVQKAVELGAFEIVPVIMDRCVVKFNDEKSKIEKTRRWQKVSVEAVKQCGRGIIPKVYTPVDFGEALKMLCDLDLSIMPYEIFGYEGDRGLKSLLKTNKDAKSIGVLVGPEGGFSDPEAKLAEENGINLIGLGKRILRTETVGSTLISILMYENDEI